MTAGVIFKTDDQFKENVPVNALYTKPILHNI